jgi:hypothetical protein
MINQLMTTMNASIAQPLNLEEYRKARVRGEAEVSLEIYVKLKEEIKDLEKELEVHKKKITKYMNDNSLRTLEFEAAAAMMTSCVRKTINKDLLVLNGVSEEVINKSYQHTDVNMFKAIKK